MTRFRFCLPLILLGSAAALAAAEPKLEISAASLLARTRILSSDAFEGRAPGSAGEEKTVTYLAAEFKKLGLAPGNPDGTYFQNVPLVGITSRPTLSSCTCSSSSPSSSSSSSQPLTLPPPPI